MHESGDFRRRLEFTIDGKAFQMRSSGMDMSAFWPIALRLPHVARTMLVQQDELNDASTDDLEDFQLGCRVELVDNDLGRYQGRYERLSIKLLAARREDPGIVYQVFICPLCSRTLVMDIGLSSKTVKPYWFEKGSKLVPCDWPFDEEPGGVLVEAKFPHHMTGSVLEKFESQQS